MKLLLLDESGDHNLKRISQNYPVFVLGGVIIDRAYLRNVVKPRMRQFKLDHFGWDDIVLHTVDMSKGRGNYSFLADPTLRASFYADLNTMLQELEYQVVACVIRKDAHLNQYGTHAADPYHYSLEILVERFCMALGNQLDSGYIIAEKRNPGLDRELLAAWGNLLTNNIGTSYMSSQKIDERIIGLELKDKKPNLVGMQLADLVVTPIGRHIAGVPPKTNEVHWSVVESKLRRVGGSYWGKGLVVRP